MACFHWVVLFSTVCIYFHLHCQQYQNSKLYHTTFLEPFRTGTYSTIAQKLNLLLNTYCFTENHHLYMQQTSGRTTQEKLSLNNNNTYKYIIIKNIRRQWRPAMNPAQTKVVNSCQETSYFKNCSIVIHRAYKMSCVNMCKALVVVFPFSICACLPIVYIWNNELERAKHTIYERQVQLSVPVLLSGNEALVFEPESYF